MIDVRVNWLKEIDSTNSEAHRYRHEASDFTVWAAEFQTAGRGQRGNSWESAVGENLTFSILLKPHKFLSTRQFELSEVVALGVVNYLASKGIDAKIKWPNDIYVGDKKICGILIENVLSGDTLSVCIAGIGLNLNQRVFRSDAPNPTSVALELDRPAGNRGGNTTPLKSTVSQASAHEIAPSSGETPIDASENANFPSVTKHPLNDREELLLLLQEITKLYFPLTQPDTDTNIIPDSESPVIPDSAQASDAATTIPNTISNTLLSPPQASDAATLQTTSPTLQEQYLSVLYRRDELHTYVDLTTGDTFRGYIRGVEKNACLRIETETGIIKSFAFKELKYII